MKTREQSVYGHAAQEALGSVLSKAGGDAVKGLFYVTALCPQHPFSSTAGRARAGLVQGSRPCPGVTLGKGHRARSAEGRQAVVPPTPYTLRPGFVIYLLLPCPSEKNSSLPRSLSSSGFGAMTASRTNDR